MEKCCLPRCYFHSEYILLGLKKNTATNCNSHHLSLRVKLGIRGSLILTCLQNYFSGIISKL